MPTNLKRYDFVDLAFAEMKEETDGDYVKYADVEPILLELHNWSALMETFNTDCRVGQIDCRNPLAIKELARRCEPLRKACQTFFHS